MSGFPILDLVVGMMFIYFLLCVICSSAIEMILTGMNARARILKEWTTSIFDKVMVQPDGRKIKLGQSILDHCAVISLSKEGKAPSYIDAKNFTSALIEKITYDPSNPKSIAGDIDSLIEAIENTDLLSTEIRRTLLSYANDVKQAPEVIADKAISALELFRKKVETWYDSSMDRLTGTLKRRYSRPCTLIIATIATVVMNADSLAIAKYLYSNPEARAKVAAQALAASRDTTYLARLNAVKLTPKDSLTLEQVKTNISLSLQNVNEASAALKGEVPLGWRGTTQGPILISSIISKITGLLATIMAIFMGAPFWFDMLNKIANVRGTGPKPPSNTGKDS